MQQLAWVRGKLRVRLAKGGSALVPGVICLREALLFKACAHTSPHLHSRSAPSLSVSPSLVTLLFIHLHSCRLPLLCPIFANGTSVFPYLYSCSFQPLCLVVPHDPFFFFIPSRSCSPQLLSLSRTCLQQHPFLLTPTLMHFKASLPLCLLSHSSRISISSSSLSYHSLVYEEAQIK